jgi:hypothetical protein
MRKTENITTGTPAGNGRFCESGGVCPPEHLCKFVSVSPAQAFVNPRPRKAAWTLGASGESGGERILYRKSGNKQNTIENFDFDRLE